MERRIHFRSGAKFGVSFRVRRGDPAVPSHTARCEGGIGVVVSSLQTIVPYISRACTHVGKHAPVPHAADWWNIGCVCAVAATGAEGVKIGCAISAVDCCGRIFVLISGVACGVNRGNCGGGRPIRHASNCATRYVRVYVVGELPCVML